MIKKYFPFIIIGLLVSYVVFDFLQDKRAVTTMEKANVTDGSSGQGVLDESSHGTHNHNHLHEESLIESSQIPSNVEFAPDFELSNRTGASVNLSDYRGKIVILNFWATWCPPCREEMPHMQSFYEKNKGNDIEIVAVNLTDQDVGQQAVEQFVQDFGLTFPVLLDENGYVGTMYEVMTIPTSYVLDTEGRIFQKVVGPMDEQMMNDMVNAIRMYDEEHGE